MIKNIKYVSNKNWYEAVLFGKEVPASYEGQYRIGVKCDESVCKCELTVYQVRSSKYELVFACSGAIGKNGAGKLAEGDGKTPCGTFTVGKAYGIKDNPGSIISYERITDEMYWRGDSTKPDYNKLVYASRLPGNTDFSNDEHLIEYNGAYDYLLDIGYNAGCVPYAGSAVFLHCRKNENAATGGCIAIAEKNMIKLLKTITPGTQITIY